MKTKLGSLIALTLLTTSLQGAVINFNDGNLGADVGAFYAGLGVSFSNAKFDNFACQGVCGPIDGLSITNSTGAPYQPTAAAPIVINFAAAQSFVSIYGFNVGANGARIVAYDAASGGNQLGLAEDFGTGVGSQNNPLLSIAAAGILRVELYQPASGTTEGLLWDVLEFEPDTVNSEVPEPSTFALAGAGVMALAWLRRRK